MISAFYRKDETHSLCKYKLLLDILDVLFFMYIKCSNVIYACLFGNLLYKNTTINEMIVPY